MASKAHKSVRHLPSYYTRRREELEKAGRTLRPVTDTSKKGLSLNQTKSKSVFPRNDPHLESSALLTESSGIAYDSCFVSLGSKLYPDRMVQGRSFECGRPFVVPQTTNRIMLKLPGQGSMQHKGSSF